MIFGYARVSTADQQLHLQTDALQAYGCDEIAQEKVSSVKERPALQHLLTRLRAGDTLVVWKLDRLGRSLKDLVTLVTGFQERGVQFISLQDHLDTTTAQGRLMFNLFASLAEFERDIIRERTKAGLTAARARGRQGGRPKGLSKEALSKAQAAKTLYLQQDKTVAEIGQLLGVGRATIYRYILLLGVPTGGRVATLPSV
ncbi:recombinase family protein (plasmid) [Hymenobacter sp. NBH84]|uniref:recombinase family protein n=1 Tax=Hymenobacter sp. NBH84 TaxID=2596915 RepID=UPI00162969E5|nr:recombinase family protein [Hymenobacter sp. NBH84]QNE42002.1 recombinase family protein [Hymenobacter sp. NBH84]